jgi:hypothetical protein
MNLITDLKFDLVALKAADNETLTGSTLDMQGYEGVGFLAGALKGEILAVTVKAQQGAASDMSDAADLLGTSTAIATTVAADGFGVLEVYKPQERYVRPLLIMPNATAATPAFVVAIRYGKSKLPITNSGELHIAPAEGTA